MDNIRIMRLILENFKCHGHLVLELEGRNASVYGDNATGKTSIYDALTWLLFGKDSAGNGEKNIEIKPLTPGGGVKDHEALTAVEAVLLVDGEEVALRRTYKEVWSTKRGDSEVSYDGNTSEYYVDGVPCKKNAFQARVNELVSEDTFRMLTSVSHFASGISWQERRGVLFKVAGIMEDDQILATNERFRPLAQGKGRLNLEDYKKKLLAEKKGFVGARTEIPARISECQRTVEDLQGLDFAAARQEADGLRSELDSVAAQLIAIGNDSDMQKKRMEIRETQLGLEKLEYENRKFRDSQCGGAKDLAALRSAASGLRVRLENKKTLLNSIKQAVGNYDRQIAASRERWISVNTETFNGGTCPTCGQEFPIEQLKAAMDTFEAQKKSRLAEIEETARAQKEAKANVQAQADAYTAEISGMAAELEGAVVALGAAEAAVTEIVDMEDYAPKKRQAGALLKTLNDELRAMQADSYAAKERLGEEQARLKARLAELADIVSKESLLEYSRKRCDELRADAKSAAECLEAIDKMLYLLDEYSRYKTRFVEDSINGLFRIARFRLFREQANGGVEDRCDVVYDGVPYMGLNNGMKINVGIDIINTLSRAYGVTVPLFVDNAESVTKLEAADGQVIRLVVSEKDKELRVEYEN